MRQRYLFLSFFAVAKALVAQGPATDHAWLTTDNISVRITPTGIHADNTGGFLLNGAGGQPLNLLRHLSPWIGGVDPAGNLELSCEMDNAMPSDWKSGFQGIPNSAKVWKVTREQVEAHLADFQDNGFVDNPIPEIFSWPGRGSDYSFDYNGFEVPNSLSAPFFDSDGNGFYNPDNGDVPAIGIRANSIWLYPSQMTFSPFFNDTIGVLTHAKSIHTEGALQAFTFDCNNHEFLENTVFLAYQYRFLDPERMDSTYFGAYADFSIGDPADDYLGCRVLPSKMIYAYNSDTLFDAVAGFRPPLLGLNFFRGPLDTLGGGTQLEKVMPILADSTLPWTLSPSYPQEFYRYLSGSWKDGSPLTYGGTGYYGISPADFAYVGHPADPNGWSELSAGNSPGHRKAVASYKQGTLLQGAVNEMIVGLSASKADGVTAQLAQLKDFSELQFGLLYTYHWLDSTLHDLCLPHVGSVEPVNISGISISPNPAADYLSIQSTGSAIREVAMFDILGKKVLSQKTVLVDEKLSLETRGLPPGLYTLHWVLTNGQRGAGKVVLAR